jgi:hypothetical protein
VDKHLLLALVNPLPGREQAFNEWYDSAHLREVVALPGFAAGQRFALGEPQRPGQAPPPWKYLALYEIEGDVSNVHDVVRDAAAAGSFTRADPPVFADDHAAWLYRAIGPRITG